MCPHWLSTSPPDTLIVAVLSQEWQKVHPSPAWKYNSGDFRWFWKLVDRDGHELLVRWFVPISSGENSTHLKRKLKLSRPGAQFWGQKLWTWSFACLLKSEKTYIIMLPNVRLQSCMSNFGNNPYWTLWALLTIKDIYRGVQLEVSPIEYNSWNRVVQLCKRCHVRYLFTAN